MHVLTWSRSGECCDGGEGSSVKNGGGDKNTGDGGGFWRPSASEASGGQRRVWEASRGCSVASGGGVKQQRSRASTELARGSGAAQQFKHAIAPFIAPGEGSEVARSLWARRVW